MNMCNNKSLIVWVVVSLVVGIVGGYYFGETVGVKNGIAIEKQEVLNQQKATEEAKLKSIQEEANPFSKIEDTVNPFKDAYKNPFAK